LAHGLWQNQTEHDQDIEKLQKLIERIFLAANKPKKAPNLYAERYASWMGELPQELKQIDIRKILLPGTHDSAAYQVEFQHSLPQFSKIQKLVCFLPFVGKIIAGWTITQDMNLHDQLMDGIRYFDLRISYHTQEKRFYLTHTFTCVPLEEVLQQMRTFMDYHPGEVIIISSVCDWEDRQDMQDLEREKEMVQLFEHHFKNLLVPPTLSKEDPEAMTLENLVKNDYRIFFYYDSLAGHIGELPEVWNGQNIKSPGWSNTSDVTTTLEGLNNGVNKVDPAAQDFFQLLLL